MGDSDFHHLDLEKLRKDVENEKETREPRIREVRLKDEFTSEGKIRFAEQVRKQYEKTYGLAGNHSGVQICPWNKKSVKGQAVCYKQKFYGIETHRCAQMSPALAWCTESCTFCWRPMEWFRKTSMHEHEVDDPAYIIEETVKQRRRLVSGLGGAAGADPKKFKEALDGFPSHWAISLSGEPTIYPKLGGMIKLLKQRKEVRSIFIVSNGQDPEAIAHLAMEDGLPTQFYLSLQAPDAELFRKINRSVYKDGWERLNRTLELMTTLNCRRVIRFTLLKGINDTKEYFPKFAALFEKSRVDFLEIKSYMFLGFSRQRLKFDNMAEHEYIRQWSAKLLEQLPTYTYNNEDAASRIVLLKRKDSPYPDAITEGKVPNEEFARDMNGDVWNGH